MGGGATSTADEPAWHSTGRMSAVVNVALPVFAIIGLGYLAGRLRLLGEASSEALNAFVYWVALPAILFLAMAATPVSESLNWPFIGAFLGGTLAAWLAGAVVGQLVHAPKPSELTMQGMNAAFANVGYMGIPLLQAAFGPAGLAPSSLATVICSSVGVALAVVLLQLDLKRSEGLAPALAGVVSAIIRNPLVMAPIAGMLWSITGLGIGEPFERLFGLLGSAAGPCALFAVGLFLAGRGFDADPFEIGWITVLKLVWQPLATWWLATQLFGLDAQWTMYAVLLAALPTGALTFVVAQRYGVYVERTSAVILVSTVVSVVTLSLLLAGYVAPEQSP